MGLSSFLMIGMHFMETQKGENKGHSMDGKQR